MAPSSGNSYTSTKSQSSGTEEDLKAVMMNERKNKRKLSNRESARRSRMRKRNHLEDLTKQVSELTKENGEIVATINMTTEQYLNVEAENSILRVQMNELSERLQSLNDIVDMINATTTYERDCYLTTTSAQTFMNAPLEFSRPLWI